MAEDGSRIPAWRRLGLALKNEIQSGVAAPEPSTHQNILQHNAPYDGRNGSHDDFPSPIEPAVNGKSPKLGKRKHQHEPADEDGQTTKKGKTSATETTAIDGPAVAEIDSVQVQTVVPETSAADALQPKGDPNYRRKKERPSRSKRRYHENTQVELESAPAQTQANHDRSSHSPDAAVPKKTRRTLLASTETTEQALAPAAATPERHRETSKGSNKDTSGSPTGFDRRKSVAFTPDTKRVDGSSAQDLFKKWVAEQKDSDFSIPDVVDSTPVPVAHEEVNEPANIDKKQKGDQAKTEAPGPEKASIPPSKGKKKDPSIYISYLTQYHLDRDHWKFNKAKQNDVIDNALNVFRIPDEHSEALLEYVQGLKGAGVIERLGEKCEAILKDLDEQDAMADPARQAMQDEALQARIAKEQKRRKVEGDVEGLLEHPHSDGYIRRMRRKRAEALLTALGRTAPILPATHTNGINPMLKNVAPVRDSKKRKRRSDISSDESSSDSSSEDDSSSSESEAGDSSDSESSSGSSDADSDSGSEEGSGSGSDSDSD